MDALDGNAIGGLLNEIFGTEMTDAVGTCGTCGATGQVAETVVYLRAPGTVVRCRTCTAVLMVVRPPCGDELRRPARPGASPLGQRQLAAVVRGQLLPGGERRGVTTVRAGAGRRQRPVAAASAAAAAQLGRSGSVHGNRRQACTSPIMPASGSAVLAVAKAAMNSS